MENHLPPNQPIQSTPPISPVVASPAPKTPMFPIFFTILFLAVFLVAGYFGYQNLPAVKVDRLIKDCMSRGGSLGESYPPQCFTSTPTPTQFADLTTNWKIYSNEDLGIMFKHPTELKEDTTGSSGINGISLEDSNYRIVILSGMNRGGAREESEKFINDIAAEGKKITVGGQPGSLSSLSYQGSKIITAYIISNRNDSLYSVSIQTKTTSISTDVENIFDQILSTFKFTDGSNTTPIIVSSSKYRYSLEIPSDWTKLAGPPEDETLFNFRKGDFEIGLSIIPTTTKTIQSYLQLADRESQTAWEGQPSIKVISTKLTKINAYSVVKREEDWLAAAFAKPIVNTYFLYQGNIYSITLKYLGSASNPTVTEETVYNQALSTFKFNQ